MAQALAQAGPLGRRRGRAGLPLGGKEAPVDRISVDMAEHFWWFDSGKAAAELGFTARDPQLTLHDTVKYLRQGVARDL